ncbi:MAG TPA: GNAT family N-acetyltransferase [Symbiobacteriaceae bacterium]|jgi:ribosomal protein S18 acetylase RimI-like enzyme|nr:GNAT family N-acetyltransferase [Symbiobacteriaceae bacterium]
MATIRTITPADYPAVAALADDAARRTLLGRPLWETAADVAAEVESLKNGALIVAESDNGAVAGLAGYRLLPGGEAAVYGPLVAEEGHGVGAWLESRVVAMAEQQGARSFSLLVGTQNQAGNAWAQWRGYQRDTEEPEQLLTWLYPGELTPGRLAEGALVRHANAGDTASVEALFSETFPRELAGPQGWMDQCWVVESAGQVEGFLRLDPSTAWVEYLCVNPSRRRQGLGVSLLVGVVQRFWEHDSRKVGLAVPLDDTAPVSLFRRLGFRREVPVAKWMKR